jgi:hypothetical protein
MSWKRLAWLHSSSLHSFMHGFTNVIYAQTREYADLCAIVCDHAHARINGSWVFFACLISIKPFWLFVANIYLPLGACPPPNTHKSNTHTHTHTHTHPYTTHTNGAAEAFSISYTHISTAHTCVGRLQALGSICPCLTSLDLSRRTSVDDHVVSCILQGLTALQALKLNNCPAITDEAFQGVPSLCILCIIFIFVTMYSYVCKHIDEAANKFIKRMMLFGNQHSIDRCRARCFFLWISSYMDKQYYCLLPTRFNDPWEDFAREPACTCLLPLHTICITLLICAMHVVWGVVHSWKHISSASQAHPGIFCARAHDKKFLFGAAGIVASSQVNKQTHTHTHKKQAHCIVYIFSYIMADCEFRKHSA